MRSMIRLSPHGKLFFMRDDAVLCWAAARHSACVTSKREQKAWPMFARELERLMIIFANYRLSQALNICFKGGGMRSRVGSGQLIPSIVPVAGPAIPSWSSFPCALWLGQELSQDLQ